MPITPSYTWQESATWVTIHVALRSISLASIDILTTDCYVKVNCHPYLFQVDLFGDIESKKSSAVVDKNVVRFFLVKKHHCLWGRLQAVGEKKDIISKRERSLDLERERSNKLKEDSKVRAAQIGRRAVQCQMKLDEEKRKLLEDRKAEELKLEQYSKVSQVPNALLPAPRQNVSVWVKFTPKPLSVNLPARESRDMVSLKEKKVTTSDTIDISEREPLFLQDKGDEFYLRNNFSSAINAYTEALEKDPSLFLCLANRAACCLHLKQFQPCIEDCTAALLLLQEKKMDMPEEPQLMSEASDMNKLLLDACLEDSNSDGLKAFAQESLKLLQDIIHSKEKTKHTWFESARKKILMRRGIALSSLKESKRAKQDLDQVFGSDLAIEALTDVFSITQQN